MRLKALFEDVDHITPDKIEAIINKLIGLLVGGFSIFWRDSKGELTHLLTPDTVVQLSPQHVYKIFLRFYVDIDIDNVVFVVDDLGLRRVLEHFNIDPREEFEPGPEGIHDVDKWADEVRTIVIGDKVYFALTGEPVKWRKDLIDGLVQFRRRWLEELRK